MCSARSFRRNAPRRCHRDSVSASAAGREMRQDRLRDRRSRNAMTSPLVKPLSGKEHLLHIRKDDLPTARQDFCSGSSLIHSRFSARLPGVRLFLGACRLREVVLRRERGALLSSVSSHFKACTPYLRTRKRRIHRNIVQPFRASQGARRYYSAPPQNPAARECRVGGFWAVVFSFGGLVSFMQLVPLRLPKPSAKPRQAQ